METVLRHRGRDISAADVQSMRELIAVHPELSRRALSAKLCEKWNWTQANGALCDMVARGLMLALHRAGHIELPPPRQVTVNSLANRRKPKVVPIVDRAPDLLKADVLATAEQVELAHG